MPLNASRGNSAVAEEDFSEISSSAGTITHAKALYILRIMMYGVTPAISVLGIVGNVFSIIILLKHGLHKCSNILLISLAVTDTGFLLAFNSVLKIFYEIVGVEYAWECSEEVCFAAFIFYNITTTVDYGMCSISLTLPMLITIERLIAVFLPFKFNLIVTPARTWFAVGFVYLFWYSFYIYMGFWFKFSYTHDPQHNISLGLMERSGLYFENLQTGHVKGLEDLIDYMLLKIPPGFTFIGCICISVKVKMASNKRRKLTQTSSKEASSMRTTKMLLAVCVVYMVTCAAQALPVYLPQLVTWTLTSDAPSDLGRVAYQIMSTIICINSSVNFVVYVGMNKNFMDTYKSLFLTCAGCKRSETPKNKNQQKGKSIGIK